jgi:hypothetical protein
MTREGSLKRTGCGSATASEFNLSFTPSFSLGAQLHLTDDNQFNGFGWQTKRLQCFITHNPASGGKPLKWFNPRLMRT